jgi:hypothetical protein
MDGRTDLPVGQISRLVRPEPLARMKPTGRANARPMTGPGATRLAVSSFVARMERSAIYAYVNNNPLNLTDPRGFCVEDACVLRGQSHAWLFPLAVEPLQRWSLEPHIMLAMQSIRSSGY